MLLLRSRMRCGWTSSCSRATFNCCTTIKCCTHVRSFITPQLFYELLATKNTSLHVLMCDVTMLRLCPATLSVLVVASAALARPLGHDCAAGHCMITPPQLILNVRATTAGRKSVEWPKECVVATMPAAAAGAPWQILSPTKLSVLTSRIVSRMFRDQV